jgi:predicted phage terminase large subunit-like protein
MWTFPSGARIRFAHLQHDKNKRDWDGAQIPLICFDELIHFTAEQFFYLLSRNRTTIGIKPYVRAATNPAPGWVADLIDWWINDDGYPIPDRAGCIRWFIRRDGRLIWADDPQELIDQFGNGDEVRPKSLTFIPANLHDNEVLMKKDPAYRANLLALPLIERERLLAGNWKIQPEGGKVFDRAWFTSVPAARIPAGGIMCRFWDMAATEKRQRGDPDYTAGVLIKRVGDMYYIMDCIARQIGPAEIDRLIKAQSVQDQRLASAEGARYMVRWEQEPSAGKRETRRIVAMLAGFDANGVPTRGQDKLTRARSLAAQSEHGFVLLQEGDWNMRWLTHMHNQPHWPHDDIMDASAGAFNALSGGQRRKAGGRQG